MAQKIATMVLMSEFIFLTLLTVALGTDPTTVFNADKKYTLEIGENVSFSFYGKNGSSVVLNGQHTSSVFKTNGRFERCVMGNNELDVCVNWGAHIVNISVVSESCLLVEASQPGDSGELSACFLYENFQWFGSPSRFHQDWPVQKVEIEDTPFLTGYDSGQFIAEPFWFTSEGASIYVFPDVPLFWESDTKTLCLKAKNARPYLPRNVTSLRYEICTHVNAVETQRAAINRYFGIPTVRTNASTFEDAAYAVDSENISQDMLSTFLQEVQNQNFPVNQIEIRSRWEMCYGTLEFDKTRFPSIQTFTKGVHDLGGKVSLSVHPFVSEDCQPSFNDALKNNRFVNGESDMEIVWNGEKGSIIDITNLATAQWFANRIAALQKTSGVDSFNFDFGQSSNLPLAPKLTGNENNNPDTFIKAYAEFINLLPGENEIIAGRNSQNLSVWVRMSNKTSSWGLDNGLQTVLGTLFQMNLAGYPFVVSDYVGGNQKPTKELFIRWLQAVTFMPKIQFSVLPWEFDTETVEISRALLALHNAYAYLFQSAAKKAIADGTPINTPIWWIDPEDTTALQCTDEYLLGGTVLVAPVLEEGAIERAVYLPKGKWYNKEIGNVEGPTWLKNFPAPINTLPYFVKDLKSVK